MPPYDNDIDAFTTTIQNVLTGDISVEEGYCGYDLDVMTTTAKHTVPTPKFINLPPV